MLCSFHKNGPEIEFSEIAKIWLDKFRKMKYNNSRKSRHATVAQLVEQLIRNQQVAGSSPASSSKSSPCSQGLLFRCRNHPHRLRRWGSFSQQKPAARKTRTAGLKLCYSSAFFCSSRS